MTDDADAYARADDRLLARAIRELHYEGLLQPQPVGRPAPDGGQYEVGPWGAIAYRFVARRSAWGDLHVVPGSVTRHVAGEASDLPRPRSVAFLVEARHALDLDGIVLGNLVEEVLDTLVAEAAQCRRLEAGAARIATRRGTDLEQCLDAHPKIIGNRGRLGFGWRDVRAYAPEHDPDIALVWLGARAELVHATPRDPARRDERVAEVLGASAHADLRRAAAEAGLDLDHDAVLPVHPWQWDHYVRQQYAAELADGRLVALGTFGDTYRPRASIRTLAHRTRPRAPDLKVSLSILNTSCHRGISADYLRWGPALSNAVHDLASTDPVLGAAGLVVLRDLGGVHVAHRLHAASGGPYRYRELLGAIWRESAASRIDPALGEVATAALYQRDLRGDSLLRQWVEGSGTTAEAWMRALARHTVVPLYHLLCAYGIGVIAHGQNISLLLRDDRPAGLVLRDFHGDVRLVQAPWPEAAGLPAAVTDETSLRRPVEEIVHDLFTGHFVSVLRFVAPIFDADLGLPERRVYAIAMDEVRAWAEGHPNLAPRIAAAALDAPRMVRVCVNRSRFRIGYGDLATRPRPDLGPPLANPLADTVG